MFDFSKLFLNQEFIKNNPNFSSSNNSLVFNSEAVLLMDSLKENSIDLIIADPPYFEIKGDFDFVWQNKEEYLEWTKKWLLSAKRILKDNGTLILWGGVGPKPLTFARIAIMIEDENLFHIQNWVTQRNTRGIGTKKNYMSAREDFLFLTKSKEFNFNVPYLEEKSNRKDLGANGKPRTNTHKRVSNVWVDIAEASQSSIERCSHPTVKAQKLCDRLIKTHSNENDIVFIPFVGSGSEVISSIKHNRIVLGTEIFKDYFELSEKRIKQFLEKQ